MREKLYAQARQRVERRGYRKEMIRFHPQGHAPNDLLSLAQSYFLKFLEISKIELPVKDQLFNTRARGEHFTFKP